MNVKNVKKPINSVILDRIIMNIFFQNLTWFRIIAFNQMNNYFVILAAGKSKRFHKKYQNNSIIIRIKRLLNTLLKNH